MSVLKDAVGFAQKEIQRKIDSEKYFYDVSAWAEYMVGVKLWSKQVEIANDIKDSRNIAVKAAHGVGKSFLAAVLICWWIDTRYPEVFVASTAPSKAQISAIVWREVRKMKGLIEQRFEKGLIDHKLPGYITADEEWKEEGGNILGFGRKPPENKEESSYQGIHTRYVLAIGDEAVGLTGELIDSLSNITSNETSRRILLCNPTNPASYVGKLFKNKVDSWSYHTISVFDSPNFTGNPDGLPAEALAELVGPSYVEDKKAEYGENSARYKARVLGEFAWDLGDTLIAPEDVALAQDTEIIELDENPVWLGVDVARFGKDLSTIYVNHGGKLRFYKSFEQNSLVELAGFVHRAAVELGAAEVRYDVQGVGQGFEELLLQQEPRPYKMIGLSGSAASPDNRQWLNARAYWWDSFRKQLRSGQIDLDPTDDRLQDELIMVEYGFSPKGGLKIQSKDEMRKQGKKSPDFADAAIYASVDLDEMLNPTKVPKQITEDAETVIGGDLPDYMKLMVQGW